MSFILAVNANIEVRVYSAFPDVAQVAVNTWRAKLLSISGAPPEVESGELADAISSHIAAPWRGCQADKASYSGLSLQDFPGRTYAPAWSILGRGAGTLLGDPLPPQTSGIISLRTFKSGPSGRGRLYIPFPPEGNNGSSGYPTVGYTNALGVVAALLAGPQTITVGTRTVVYSPFISKAKAPTVMYPIDTGYGEGRWATQMRRGEFGRTNVLPAPLS